MKHIESTQNAFVKHWKKLVQNRKERDQSNEFLVEGFHLVEEALKFNETILTIIKREDVEIPSTWKLEGIAVIEVTRQVAKEISETEHSQGIYAHCKQYQGDKTLYKHWKKLLWIDAVQDPGNVGTMIRTADASGMDAVIIGKGSADPYNPKTVRSAQGSHFHIPIIKGDLMEWMQFAKEQRIYTIGTSLHDAVNYEDVSPQEKFALIMGNEGRGLDKHLLENTNVNVYIPIHGKAESLNVAVAAGILLYKYV